MPAELIKISYLQLETGVDDDLDEFTDAPILNNLDSLFPLLSNNGLYRWAKYVFTNLEKWEPDFFRDQDKSHAYRTLKSKVIHRFDSEVDERFPVPSDKNEQKRILAIRDGLGCVCRRSRPDCGFQEDSGHLLKDYHVGHVFPLDHDGPHIWSNLALISPSCNSSQGPEYFHRWIKKQTGQLHGETFYWSPKRPKSDRKEDLIASIGRRWEPVPPHLIFDSSDEKPRHYREQ